MKIRKKIISLIAGCFLVTPAFIIAKNNNLQYVTKAEDELAYTTSFSGAKAEDEAYQTYWTFSEPIKSVDANGGISFGLTKYTTSCTLTFKNAFLSTPYKITKVEVEVSANPSDLDATGSASVRPMQSSSGTTKTITENGVRTKVTQEFSGGTGNITIRLNNLYDGPNTIWVYSVSFYEASGSVMSISAGEGISSVYLSTDENALSGYPSGSTFAPGYTIYGFAVLADGYKHQSHWTKVSSGDDDVEGAIYRVGSYMNAGLDHDFGEISATKKQTKKLVYFYGYDGQTLTDVPCHEFRVGDGAYIMPTPVMDEYHTYYGWNSSINWDGDSYDKTLTAEQVDKIASGEDEVEALYVVYLIKESIQDFMNKVEDISYDVEISDEYEAAIKKAYAAYNVLSDGEKQTDESQMYYSYLLTLWEDYISLAIDNIGEPTEVAFKENYLRAEAIYEELPETEKDNIQSEKFETAKVEYVKILIDEIGDVAYTEECDNKISNAEERYEKLSSENKALVTNHATLQAASNTYDAVDNVVKKIDAIGEVEYTNECKNKIDGAREAYDALSAEEKNILPEEKYQTLVDDETLYESLKPTSSNELPNWAVALIAVGALFLGLGLVYVLVFFVFNKWIIVDDKPIRGIRVGKKYNAYSFLTYRLSTEIRAADQIYKTKQEAINSLK